MRDQDIRELLLSSAGTPDSKAKDRFVREIRKRQDTNRMSFIRILLIQFRYYRSR